MSGLFSGFFGGFGKGLEGPSNSKDNSNSASPNVGSSLGSSLKDFFSPTSAGTGLSPQNAAISDDVGDPFVGQVGAAGPIAAADADLKEPGGEAHWTLREEENFILAKNQHTGEVRKLLTAPLSKKEQQEAGAKHGAGPLDANAPNRQHTTMSDMNIGGGSYADVDLAGAESSAGNSSPDPYVQVPEAAPTPPNSPHQMVQQMLHQHVQDVSQSIVDALDAKFKKKKKSNG